MNAVILEGKPVGKYFTGGRCWPWTNIINTNVRFAFYFKGNIKNPLGVSSSKRSYISSFNVNNYENSLYLRFEVKDKPGVLSEITKNLAKNRISIQE